MATGIDVSYAQSKPNWTRVKATGKVDFVYTRATSGTKTVDVQFSRNWAELKSAGFLRGAYHFYVASSDPIEQAEFFFKTVGELAEDDLPPMLDVEQNLPKNKTGDEYAKDVLRCIEHLEKLFGRKVVVYTGLPVIIVQMKNASSETLDKIADRDLWLSAYVKDPKPWVPKIWSNKGKSWVIWQKSGDVDALGRPGFRIDGINTVVDLNVTQGPADDLKAWIESSKLAPVKTPPHEEEEEVEEPEVPVYVDEPAQPLPPEPPPKPVPPAPIVPGDRFGLLTMLFSFIRAIFLFFTGRRGS